MTSKVFFFLIAPKQRVLLSQRRNLVLLLIDRYLISHHWDIKVGRSSILFLSGKILQSNNEMEHSSFSARPAVPLYLILGVP